MSVTTLATVRSSSTLTGRILVVEDDLFMSEALEMALTLQGHEVCVRPDGMSIDKVVAEFRPAVAVVDLNVAAGPDGISLVRRVRTLSDLPIMVVSASDEIEERLSSFEVGADDFLPKPFSMAELFVRVQVLLRRAKRQPSPVIEAGEICIDDRSHVATRNGQPLQLRNLEYQLLRTFCLNPNQVLSKVQLLDAVWGFTLSDVNLVEVHMSRLRSKLEACGPRVIHTIRSVGYVLRTDQTSTGS